MTGSGVTFTARAIFDHSLKHARTELEWTGKWYEGYQKEKLEWVKDW